MKILNMVFIFVAVLFSMAIFDYHGAETSFSDSAFYNANYTNYSAGFNYSSYVSMNTTSGEGYYSSNIIWELFTSPFRGGGTLIIGMLIALVTYIAIINLFNIIGFNYRSDLALLSPLFMFLIGVGFLPIVVIYNFINRETAAYACKSACVALTDCPCWFSEMTAALIAGSLFFMWIAACIEWWTQRSVSN